MIFREVKKDREFILNANRDNCDFKTKEKLKYFKS